MILRIDFARPARFSGFGARVLVVGSALVVVALLLYGRLVFLNRDLDGKVQAVQSTIKARQPTPLAEPVLNAAEQQRIRRASTELSTTWGQMLNAIEASHLDTITLLSIESESSGATLRLAGLGQSYSDILGFVERLSNRSVFYDVLLVSHQTTTSPVLESPVKFVITARWRLQ
jgi:hypothetical protein